MLSCKTALQDYSVTRKLLHPPHEVLRQCWEEGAAPGDMRDAKITTFNKNKGKRNDCNNYRGISLLSIVGKVLLKSSCFAYRY
ncbi:hypothetical protein EB796_001529 [Bugula neritina]|uniref:Uncharacterized protein n=1 Tax=Bugula neritina TaxID=10212 RepID=A0A7J7KPS3_BUGNE|nr:hypothetical protein EB796_001529 [Bugula neritina]